MQCHQAAITLLCCLPFAITLGCGRQSNGSDVRQGSGAQGTQAVSCKVLAIEE